MKEDEKEFQDLEDEDSEDSEDVEAEGSTEGARVPNHLLRQERESLGWSRKTMAIEMLKRWPDAAVTDKSIARWENGKRVPGPFYSEKLRLLFGKSAAELGLVKSSIIILTREQAAVLQEALALGGNTMANYDPKKRKTLETIVKTLAVTATGSQAFANPELWERLSRAQAQPSALNAATLNKFKDMIAQAWELANNNALEVAEGVLSSFLPQVLTIVNDEQTAYLASQGLRLQSVLTHHRLNISEKVQLCEQSVTYARQANDANTLVAALVELAAAYEFSGQTENWFRTLQEALYYSDQASPLNQAHAYSYSAVAFARHKRTREAQMYMQLAFDTFPSDPTQDLDYAFADSSIFTLSYHAGLISLDINQIATASTAFERYKLHPSGVHIPERLRLEIVNGRSRAAIRNNDLDSYVSLLDDAIASSIALGSKKLQTRGAC
jgi:transcriptional regulator with XRE-family HTH domain